MIPIIEIREINRVSENLKFTTVEAVADYCFKKPLELHTLAQENLYCFCLDTKGKAKSIELISKGSLTNSIAHPREILKAAILSNAVSIILVHNHPSGDPYPSGDDEKLTDKIVKACEIMSINLLDHIIIGKNSYYSFREKGKPLGYKTELLN